MSSLSPSPMSQHFCLATDAPIVFILHKKLYKGTVTMKYLQHSPMALAPLVNLIPLCQQNFGWAPDENGALPEKKQTWQTTTVVLAVESFCFPLYAENNSFTFLFYWDIGECRSKFCNVQFQLGVPFACLSDFVSTLYVHGIFIISELRLYFLPLLLYLGLRQSMSALSYAHKTFCELRSQLFWKSYFNLHWYAGLQHSSTNNSVSKAEHNCPAKVRNKRLGLRAVLQQESPHCWTTAPVSSYCPIHLGKQPVVTNGWRSTKNGIAIEVMTASSTGFGTAQARRCPSLSCTYFCPTWTTIWQSAAFTVRRMSFTPHL